MNPRDCKHDTVAAAATATYRRTWCLQCGDAVPHEQLDKLFGFGTPTCEPLIHSHLSDVLADHHPLAHQNVHCFRCKDLVHASNNECMKTWVEVLHGRPLCGKCFAPLLAEGVLRTGQPEFEGVAPPALQKPPCVKGHSWCPGPAASKEEPPRCWEESAAQFSRNSDYYQGLIDRIWRAIGPAAYLADDGTTSEDILRAKVPELVEKLVADCNWYRMHLDNIALGTPDRDAPFRVMGEAQLRAEARKGLQPPPLLVVTDRMQGVDCPACEDSIPHSHPK